MTRVNDKNYIRYSGYDGETVNMIETAEDYNDRINLKKNERRNHSCCR